MFNCYFEEITEEEEKRREEKYDQRKQMWVTGSISSVFIQEFFFSVRAGPHPSSEMVPSVFCHHAHHKLSVLMGAKSKVTKPEGFTLPGSSA
jgi:hypothetical protein